MAGIRVGANPAVPLRPAELKTSLDQLHRLTEKEGRDPSTLTISYKAPVYDDTPLTPAGERRPFTGAPGQILEDIETWTRLGVSELIFDVRTEDLAQSLERLERLAALVKPRR